MRRRSKSKRFERDSTLPGTSKERMRHAEFRAIDAHSQASVPKWCHDSSFLPDPIGWVGEQRKQTKAVGKSLMSPVHDALLSPARPKVRICKESYGAPFPGCLKRGWSAFGAFFHKRGGRSPVDDPLCREWRTFVNRTGCCRGVAPRECGPARGLYNRWTRAGGWESLPG